MSTMKTKQELPKWFEGDVYEEGGTVSNRFTGEEIELNNIELSMYDLVMGCSLIVETRNEFFVQEKVIKDLRKGLDWFREHNPEAYIVLLD